MVIFTTFFNFYTRVVCELCTITILHNHSNFDYMFTITCEFYTTFFFFLSFFLGQHLWHMEVPRLGVRSELQLPATATAMWDLSHICNVDHSIMATQDSNPLILTQGSDPHPQGSLLGLLTAEP